MTKLLPTELDSILQICLAAAKLGGKCLLEWKDKFSVTEKAPKDLVTEADFTSQKAIFDLISKEYPTHQLLGEEESAANVDVSNLDAIEHCWIVDPLDGTINYVHQLPAYSVSVAYANYGKVKAGTVYDPVSNDCYYAIAENGAWCNGTPIKSSEQPALDEALVIISLPTKLTRGGVHERKAIEMIHQSRTIRRLGSAALNCCYVAAGKADAYWAESISAWDIAAGALIANEAGATVTDIDGAPIDMAQPKILVTGHHQLSTRIVDLFSDIQKIS